MKIYTAGNPGTERAEVEFFQKCVKRRLLSFFYINDPKDGRKAKLAFELTKNRTDVDLLIDSGAYSAWSQNTSINIDEYIRFIKDNTITQYAGLDDINSPQKTYKNYQIMVKAGLNPIPTFHYGEGITFLQKYLSIGCNHIALGGMVPISSKELYGWLKNIFRYIPSDVKIHGFGLTALDLLTAFPWHSVDSATGILQGGLGTIIIPYKKNGLWDYLSAPRTVQASSTNISKGHINTLPDNVRKEVLSFIEESGYTLGKSIIRQVSADKVLKSNEVWVDNKSETVNNYRRMEKKIEIGVLNDFTIRYAVNTYYLDRVAEACTNRTINTSTFEPFY